MSVTPQFYEREFNGQIRDFVRITVKGMKDIFEAPVRPQDLSRFPKLNGASVSHVLSNSLIRTASDIRAGRIVYLSFSILFYVYSQRTKSPIISDRCIFYFYIRLSTTNTCIHKSCCVAYC